ncbi:hypothetical protein CONLIGDRAFT_105817 [Coniochaeta ligniaria NRRL 30616]|uniref:Cyclin-D1-binding protein 1-like N-terminal domain-containing protein n=1 Tax=Coniochaeta ligniaria NRRL 30616 TaxID=1408157 RepID=A0A1J7IAR7_9PEZI|nr:hypothetical protein CONLIGDRAFT_105817 [Coniochaeta ligniaria NRRL 30616]
MALPPTGDDALNEMGRLASTTIALVSQLETAVSKLGSDSKATTTAPLDPSIDALAVARDSATLIKAHATKISLFIINKPFTPTAITKVLRELVSGPLPGLASAAQLCDANRYTQAVSRDLAWRCGRVFKELKELVKRIPTDGKVLSDAKKNSSFGIGAEKGSVATTGLLWSACDDVITLANLGVAGYLMRKVEQFRDTLKDIMEELKEWSEEESDEEDEDDVDDGSEEENVDEVVHGSADEDEARAGESSTARTPTTQEMLDDIMNSNTHIPRDDPERIRPKLDSCLRRLRLTVLLYQAALKRRFKSLPPLPPPSPADATIARVDEVMSLLKLLPERFGSIALAFYDLDGGQIDSLMDQCFLEAFAASELLVKPWAGNKDEFTDWALKYQIEIKKA